MARRLDAEIMQSVGRGAEVIRSLGTASGATIYSASTDATTAGTGPTLWEMPIISSTALPANTMYYVAPTTTGGNWCQVYDYNGWRYVTPWAPPQGAVIVAPDLTQPYNAFAEPPYNPYEAVPLLDDSAPSRRPNPYIARERAEALLRRFLTPMQLAQFTDTDSFEVTGSLGGRFRIRYGIAGNIQRLDRVSGDWIETWCVHPADVPPGDAMLAQKVLLEQDEAHVRERANITHRDGRYTPGRRGLIDALCHLPNT